MFFSLKKYYLTINRMEDNKQIENKRDIQTTEINITKNKEKKGRKILTPEERKERDHNNYIRRKNDEEYRRQVIESSQRYYAKNKKAINKAQYLKRLEKYGAEGLRERQLNYYKERCEKDPTYRDKLNELEKERYKQRMTDAILLAMVPKRKGRPRKYESVCTESTDSTALPSSGDEAN